MLERSSIRNRADKPLSFNDLLRRPKPKRRIPAQRGADVTVCIALITDGNTIIGVSDRMLTAGDVQFQPMQRKQAELTNSIAVMISGDMAIQGEILYDLRDWVNARVKADPNAWLLVKDVAKEYSKIYNEVRLRRATRRILAPLGLTPETFVAKQKQMAVEIVNKLTTEMLNYEMPETDAILAGVDQTGAQIYVARDGAISCESVVGFAAIGAGSQHAESQLMFARYTKTHKGSRGLYLAYAAKRRAEIAPGVGPDTDMFVIGPQLGSHVLLPDDFIGGLKKIYADSRVKGQEVVNGAEAAADGFLSALAEAGRKAAETAAPESQATAKPTDGDAPAPDAGGGNAVTEKPKKPGRARKKKAE